MSFWPVLLVLVAGLFAWLCFWLVDEGARSVNADYDEDNDEPDRPH